MALFQEKIVAKALGVHPHPIPASHLAILQSWKEKIESGSLQKQTEVAIHAPFTQNIMAGVLGYTPFGTTESWTISREYGVASGAVDLALGRFSDNRLTDTVLAPFELKGAKTKDLDAIMPGRHKTPVQQAWEYARDIKGAQWVLVCNYVELRLYAVSETSLVYEQFNLAELTDPQRYARFILLLHADNLLSGSTAKLLNQSLLADKEITAQLYDDYKTLREMLIARLISENLKVAAPRLIAPAQKLLDRFLFVAFAEDKGLIPESSIQHAFEHADPYNPRPIYENFKGLFRAIDQGNAALSIPAYNGGLFATDDELDHLNVPDTVCYAVNELSKYDFDSEVSVTVLGHIFEQSIADLETLTARIEEGELPVPVHAVGKARATSGKRKRQGVVYTPDHITAFIVEHTLGSHINDLFLQLLADYGKLRKDETIQWKKGTKTELKFWYAWQQVLQHIKVVDPACGSGAFLVAAFDYLHAEYKRINDKLAELTGQHSLFDLNKEILTNNLYGVDINPESIEISKLSLWLKTAERGKSLTTLDANLIAGNSLGLAEPAPGESFCWQKAFPEIMAQGGFDVVLGNPPYVRQELFSELKPWLGQNYTVYNGVADLYTYFFELGHKLLKPGGRLGYISSSTFFKTGSGMPLRRYLAQQMTVEKIVDFGDLQVFEGVTTYPAITVMRKRPPSSETLLAILTLRQNIPANLDQYFSQEHGTMLQSRLGEQSWQLEDETLAHLRQKLVRDYPTLKEVYGSPYRGVLTGFNEAFVIDGQTRDRLIAEDPRSAELLKPFLEGKDLKKWHAEPRELWLVFTRRGVDIEKFPAIKAHLEKFHERLEPKPNDWPSDKKWPGRKPGPYQWYEIQDTVAYCAEFEKTKIFYPEFSVSSKFHRDKVNYYSNNKGFIIPDGDNYLLGFLNSSTVWALIKGICTFVRGGYYELRAIKMETLPIPPATAEQQTRIGNLAEKCQELSEKRYGIENNFRRRLPDLCRSENKVELNNKLKSWWLLDFADLHKQIQSLFKSTIPLAERNDWHDYFEAEKAKIAALNQQIAQHEADLNQEVYRLFDLTPQEIILVEA
jgi:type I restriction-modification system DNA methylase subunit